MPYVLLGLAIVAEVVATSALKATDGFTNLTPSLVVVIGYAVAFYLLALVVKSIPLGIVYALWSGLGIVLVTIAGAVLYRQLLDPAAIVGIAMIAAGVAVIHLFSTATP